MFEVLLSGHDSAGVAQPASRAPQAGLGGRGSQGGSALAPHRQGDWVHQPAPSELTVQQSQVAPSNLPDRFEIGRQSALTDVHEYQIKDLLARVSSIESSVNWGRGLVYAIGLLAAALLVFLKAFWRPILRMLINEASPPRIASPPSS